MAGDQSGQRRHRSPAYPGIPLPEAVSRLGRFYKEQKRATVHLASAAESMGYSAKSSFAPRAVAALMSYGFMHDEGSGDNRKVRISDLGYKVVLLPEDDPERATLLREAALKPKIFSALVAQWPDGLPSDSAIRKHLTLDRNFNPDSVDNLIKDFRATYEFAGLGSGAILPKDEGESDGTELDEVIADIEAGMGSGQARGSTKPPPAGMSALALPVAYERRVEIRYPSDWSEAEFKRFMEMLEGMKDTLIKPSDA